MRKAIPALFLACTAAAVAACGSSGHAASAPPDTVTATVSVTPSGGSAAPAAPAGAVGAKSSAPAAPTAPPPSTTSTTSAAAVVEAYYAAINAGHYQTAWNLGGDTLDSSYTAFVNGFSGTAHDSLTITGSQGDTVSVSLQAAQTNGSVQTYTGTYTVSGGHISSAQLTAEGGGSGGGSPTATSAPVAPITDPHGGYYRAGEFCPTDDKHQSTVDANGDQLTCVYESGGYHWVHPQG